jgi:hypothetical protein
MAQHIFRVERKVQGRQEGRRKDVDTVDKERKEKVILINL